MSSEKHPTGAPKPDERPRSEPERWARGEKEALAHFVRAMARAREAMTSYASLTQRGHDTPVNIEMAVSIPLTEARDAANLARPEVLAKLHPDLPRVWRQTFMQVVGMNATWTMAGQPPFSDATLGRQLVDLDHEWDQWWAAHRRDLAIPEDIPLWDAAKKDVITASVP
jgi:hypothetical protein